jgi:putative flippase GtrA
MFNWIKTSVKVFSERGGIFMFMRAQFTSQIASVVDFVVTILLVKLFHIYYVYATFIGSVCGGIVNCILNYVWTFKSKDCIKRYVFYKYILVWTCSIMLNTWGTYLLTETISKNPWVKKALHVYIDDLFVFSKGVVSLLVGFLWNYNMHRTFVYKNIHVKDIFAKNEQNKKR